jgi:diguanylate cyclase (GGDEF)-like protein
LQIGGYIVLAASQPRALSLLPSRWLWAGLAGSLMAFCLVAMRPAWAMGRANRAIVETLLALGSIIALCSATGPLTEPGTWFTHTSIVPVLIGVAMLVPMPTRVGVPALTFLALLYPLVQAQFAEVTLQSWPLAIACVNLSAGLGAALLVLHLHNRLFEHAVQAEEDLAQRADRDPLTGLWNRATIEAIGKRVLAGRKFNQRPCVAVIDVDRFKRINTEFGYPVGDQVLEQVGRRLSRVAAEHRGVSVGRTGGEEFLVVIENLQLDEARALAEHIVTTIGGAPMSLSAHELQVTVSVGWTLVEAHESVSWDAMVSSADEAMYVAKGAGGNRSRSSGAIRTSTQRLGALVPMTGGALRESLVPLDQATLENRARLHAGSLMLSLIVCAMWIPLLLLFDVARGAGTAGETGMGVLIAYRLLCAGFSGVLAFALWRWPGLRDHATRIHVLLCLIWILGAVAGPVTREPFVGPSTLVSTCIALATWSLALSTPEWQARFWQVLLGSGYLWITSPQFGPGWGALDDRGLVDEIYRCTTIVAMLALSFASRHVFRELRDEESRIRQELGLRSAIDPLTSLANRRAFRQRLERAIANASPDRPLALLMMDVDHFKRINDQFGHGIGDVALREVGLFLQRITPPGSLAARLGGEEFGVVAQETSEASATELAHRLVGGVRLLRTDGMPLPLTVSVGVAMHVPGESADSLYGRADAALRDAKRAGRDRAIFGRDTGAVPQTLLRPPMS